MCVLRSAGAVTGLVTPSQEELAMEQTQEPRTAGMRRRSRVGSATEGAAPDRDRKRFILIGPGWYVTFTGVS